MKRSAFLTSLMLVSLCFEVFSQVDVKMIVRNPIPSEISVWAEDPTVIQIILTNTGSNEFSNCYLGFTIVNEKGQIVVETNLQSQFIPKFQIPAAPSISMLSGDMIFNINAISFNKRLQRLALSTNSIPEGDYEMCVSVYEQYGKNITIGEEYCTGFSVLIPEPPVLISPIDDEALIHQFPMFIWTPVTNYNPGRNQIKYKLKICPVFANQSPRDAIDRNQVLFEQNDLFTTSYQYLPSDMAFDYFQGVSRFVWMVQAFDANNNPASSNQGKSELGIFRTKENALVESVFENLYPANNDTLPWLSPHLIAGLNPCSPQIRSINYALSIRNEGSLQAFTNGGVFAFNQGPMVSQGLNDEQKAGWIIGNLNNNKAFAEWMQNLNEGEKYYWKMEATYTNSDGTTFTQKSNETAFVIGLKRPSLLLPIADTSIRANKAINLEITLPRPNTLNLLAISELNNNEFHGYNSYSNAQARLRFELAKNEKFDSLIQVKTLTLPESGEIKTGDNCDAFFQKLSTKFNAVADTGTYYWRVKYIDKNDSAYFIAASRRLKIVSDSIYNCFAMEVLQPANNGSWTENKKPRFAVSVNPEIKKSAITGGRMQVWKKSEPAQTIDKAKLSKAVLDTIFKGNADTILYTYASDLSGNMRFDINLINGGSTKSKTFEADSAAYYVWNLQLNYKKDSIRKDGSVCGADSVISNDGVFQLLPTNKKKNNCPGDCFVDPPSNTTAGTQTLAKDSTLKIGKFDLKLITVSGTPANLNGTGSIQVPYIKANILVEFNGLQVNSDNKVFGGVAYAMVDANAPYTKEEGNDFQNKAFSFAADKMKFKQIHEHSSSLGKLVSGFVGSTPVTLPIGYDNDWDGYKLIVGIVGMEFSPTQGALNIASYIELPALGPDVGLGMGAKNICFHDDGFGGMDKVVIYLAQDFGYNNEESWSYLFKAPTPSDSGTYVMWDCEGMSVLTIAADVGFPHSWMTPVENPDPMAKVNAHFKARAKKHGNSWQWLASASLDNCELSGAKGYKLQVQEMVYDWSDTINPAGIIFPNLYKGDKTTHWKGFYIKRASVTLPDDLKTFDKEYPTIAVNHMMIDKTGFTASIVGENLIQYPRGDFGGWGASIDSLRVDLVNSSLQSGSIKGRLQMSIADTCLNYTGLIASDTTKITNDYKRSLKYQFTVVPKDTLKIDMLKADFNLMKTSRIELYNDSMNKFQACADLSGSVTIKGDVGGLSKLDFKGIKFENLKVMSKSPYFDKGNWSLASPEHGMNGFPVSINHVELVNGERGGSIGAGIQFDLNVGLQDGADAISGTTKLSIWGKLESESGPQHFVFDGVDLDSIGINADLGAVIIKGGLILYDSHNIFGDGFRGAVTATFVDQATVKATAQFGSVNNYRYWYVDGKALFSQGVPVFTGLGIYGFGGGAWYHMRKSGATSLSDANNTPDNGTTPGLTNSGYSYVPDKNINLGLNASMIIGTHPNPEAFNGDVGLEAQFLSNGGIGTIALVGNGFMLCDINNRNKAKVLADMNMEYNFPTKTFHGVFNVDINANPIDGGGQMTAHFDPNLWYVKIGEPSNRIGVNLDSWLSTDAYFMAGQDLPAPQLPPQILELFPNYTVHRNPMIASGDGFAFGASSSFDTGRKPYLIFYGEVSALVGFDMALLNYGEGTTCAGQTGTIGINGWYAMGDVYASVNAAIGMHVDLWFTSGNYEILSLQVGAALEGAGPNPTWVKGMVGGDYRILKGAVKGHCDYRFSMGKVCEMANESSLSRIDLISDIGPLNGQNNVSVYTEPQVAMNFELDTPFELQEMPEGKKEGKIRTFRIKLDDFKLQKTAGGDSIPGYLNIGSDKFSVYYKPHDIMAGNTNYKFSVSAFGEELINNAWTVAKKNDGSVIKQNEFTAFKTGSAPDKIELQNVAYSYPVNYQNYFLQNECRSGRIQLISGQPGMFVPRENFDMELIARFVPADMNMASAEVPFTYNAASRTIYFDIPTLMNNKRYYLQIVKKEVCNDPELAKMLQLMETIQQGGLQSNISLQSQKIFESGASNVFLSQRKITADRVNPGEKLLYVYSFKTSNFNTLQAKLNTFNHVATQSEFGVYNTEIHTATYQGAEYFDFCDFRPVKWNSSGSTHQFGPLVKINAWARNSTWHNNFANPVVYDQINWMKSNNYWSGSLKYDLYFSNPNYNFVDIDYSTQPINLQEVLGMSTGSVSNGGSSGSFSQAASNGMFSPGSMTGLNIQGIPGMSGKNEPPQLMLTYNHGLIVSSDFTKLKNRAVFVFSNSTIPKSNNTKDHLRSIINSNYTPLLKGNYPLLFLYNYFGCIGVDDSAPTISKYFVY